MFEENKEQNTYINLFYSILVNINFIQSYFQFNNFIFFLYNIILSISEANNFNTNSKIKITNK